MREKKRLEDEKLEREKRRSMCSSFDHWDNISGNGTRDRQKKKQIQDNSYCM
jgi:hypothetical protein